MSENGEQSARSRLYLDDERNRYETNRDGERKSYELLFHHPKPGRRPVLREAAKQLREYFAGKRKSFSLPLRLAGTDFQRRVWGEIARIPYGETVSYSALAQRAGAPLAVRAAGTSTGRNPAAIVVPCHRVMGKNGDLCGFGGGLERKRYLLKLENPDTSLGNKPKKQAARTKNAPRPSA